jgi:hypothetical protein
MYLNRSKLSSLLFVYAHPLVVLDAMIKKRMACLVLENHSETSELPDQLLM